MSRTSSLRTAALICPLALAVLAVSALGCFTTSGDVPGIGQDAGNHGPGVDLTNVEACTTIPADEVAAVVGKLRDSAPPRPVTSVDGEKGCTWTNDSGHFFEITFYPLSRWDTVTARHPNAQPVSGLGDGAYSDAMSDALWLEVLIAGRVDVVVRTSDESLEAAKALFNVARNHLP